MSRPVFAFVGHSENKDPVWMALMVAVWEQAVVDLMHGNLPMQLSALEFFAGSEGDTYMDAFGWEDPDTPFVMLGRLKRVMEGMKTLSRPAGKLEYRMNEHIDMATLFEGLTPEEARELANDIIAEAARLRKDVKNKQKPAVKKEVPYWRVKKNERCDRHIGTGG